jgi:hypothetical protein
MTRGEFLSEFIPVPEDLSIVAGRVGDDEDQKQKDLVAQMEVNVAKHGYANWYDYCVNEWGTKWDVGCEGYAVQPEADGRMCIGFDSAWAPPILAMEKMVDMGFSIRLYYYEPGMALLLMMLKQSCQRSWMRCLRFLNVCVSMKKTIVKNWMKLHTSLARQDRSLLKKG